MDQIYFCCPCLIALVPIKFRADLKILLFVYKALHKLSLDYICDLIQPYTASRSLRSCNQLLLSVPHSRCKSKGDRAFSLVAPKLWNSLPLIIRASPLLNAFKSFKDSFLLLSIRVMLRMYLKSLCFMYVCMDVAYTLGTVV